MRPDPEQPPIEQLAQRCRAQGLALTMQRRAVFLALVDRDDHPTADQVYDAVKASLPAISRTTVYRILDTLVQAGLIVKVGHPGTAVRFDPKIRRHHHLICASCERIIDIEANHLNDLPLPDLDAHGFQINDYCIHFRGLCAGCAQKQKTRARASKPVGRPGAGSIMKTPALKERARK